MVVAVVAQARGIKLVSKNVGGTKRAVDDNHIARLKELAIVHNHLNPAGDFDIIKGAIFQIKDVGCIAQTANIRNTSLEIYLFCNNFVTLIVKDFQLKQACANQCKNQREKHDLSQVVFA